MFYVSNDIQYRVICVPGDPDKHWYFRMHYDTLTDAQSASDAWNRRAVDGNRYYVTAIGGADSIRSGFSDVPPPAVK